MTVVWTQAAVGNLIVIRQQIGDGEQARMAAGELAQGLRKAIRDLGKNSYLGKPGNFTDTREWGLVNGRYQMVYQVIEGRSVVLSVVTCHRSI